LEEVDGGQVTTSKRKESGIAMTNHAHQAATETKLSAVRNTALVVIGLALCLSPATLAEIPPDRARKIDDAAPAKAPATPKKPRRVLIFNTPPHLMPEDPHKGYCIPYGSYALQSLGKKTGAYEAVVSDDLAMFLPQRISGFDAIVLNNTSRAWITPTDEQVKQEPFSQYGADANSVEQVLRKSLLNYVRHGGGLVAIHYAAGANRHWSEFAEMLGANMNGHPWNEEVGIKIDEPEHPLVAMYQGQDFRLADEIYQFTKPYSRDNVRVLLSLDTKKTNMGVPWIKRDDNDFALAWVRQEGKGRVFYCSLGHRTELYWDPKLLQFYLAGVQFCTGDLEAPAKPIGDAASSCP
jgi:type 1 glutamine amidotransferase